MMPVAPDLIRKNSLERLSVASITALGRLRGTAEVWREALYSFNWREFSHSVEAAHRVCQVAGVRAGSIVIVPGDAQISSLIWLFGVAAAGGIAAPLRTGRADEIDRWTEFIEIGWKVEAGRLQCMKSGRFNDHSRQLVQTLQDQNRPGLLLATGGTTGSAKVVLHDLAALLGTITVRPKHARRILPLMRFDHIGGLDMAWRALAGGQVIVAPPAEITPDSVGEVIGRQRVEILPATPSFLNLLLIADVPNRYDLSSLRVISYGAEAMPTGLLSRLQKRIPHADFIQRFGTSETGVLPVRGVGDGLKMSVEGSDFSWKVHDGELWVRSPSRALGYLSGQTKGFEPDGWFRTGDLAEENSDGSVRVLGRCEELINVGGEKVLLSEVENILLQHPMVENCRAYALPNAILGQIVGADLIWRGNEADPVVIKRILQTFFGSRLSRSKQPSVVRLVTEIEATRNFKKLRVLAP